VIMMLRGRFYPINEKPCVVGGGGSPDDKSVVELPWKEGNQTAEKPRSEGRGQH
jgi:hypothetical protein